MSEVQSIKKIYLAGKVPKSDNENFKNWRDVYINYLDLIGDFEFIDPTKNRQAEDDFFAVFGQDCSQVESSDLIIVNGEEKLGVGTSQEMIVAKYFKKPVIVVLPKDTHHRRSNIFLTGIEIKDWIHPFIYSTSDIIVENHNELENALKEINEIEIKGIEVIDNAIKYYEEIKRD